MRISIIIPTLNEALIIGRLLASLQTLRQQGHELIVVDGGSCDSTVTIAEAMADHVLSSARGRATQMNLGARRASGDLLLFLHADTLLPANCSALLHAVLPQQNHWGYFNVVISGGSFWLPIIAKMINWRSKLSGIATGDQAIFVCRQLFYAVDGYPEQPLMEDIELSRRLRRFAAPTPLRPKVIISGRRWDSNGAWPTIFLMWKLRWQYSRGISVERLAKEYS